MEEREGEGLQKGERKSGGREENGTEVRKKKMERAGWSSG
jgi:hypothetical protein